MSHSTARAGAFSLEIIAQAGDVIDGRTITGFSGEELTLAINNSGEVAFFANVASAEGTGLSLMTQNRFIAGAGKVIDDRVLRFGSEPYLDMNNHGDVAYRPTFTDLRTGEGGRGIYVNETLLVEADVSVIDGHVVSNLDKSPSINDAGTVLFNANTSEFRGVFTQSELLIRRGQSFDGFTVRSAGGLKNNAGKVAFGMSFEEFDGTAIVTVSDGILVKEGDMVDGVTIDRIRDVGFTDVGALYMNIVGTQIGGEPDGYIVTEDRIVFGPESTIRGIPDPILAGDGVVMNNAGQIAFWGAVDEPRFHGEFPDARGFIFAAGEVVISEGDVLDGKVVSRVFLRFDMNNRGDVVFEVVFEDLSKAVVVATPTIPEPTSAALAAIGVLLLLTARDMQRPGREFPLRSQEVVR
ncbi:MAG: hypothetical protein IID44_30035 [Planctomycetes bacterium]|nr:hypothetical protein [Planctomycetota bacterium]